MKKLCGCIFFLVLFFSCTKDEKTTVQQEAVSPKVFVPGELSKYVGSYSKFDKDWNLLICDIYQKDTCYYTTITYKNNVIISHCSMILLAFILSYSRKRTFSFRSKRMTGKIILSVL